TLQEMQAKRPADPVPSLLLVDFYDGRGRSADGEKLLLETKQKFPKDMNVAAKIASRFLQTQPERARPEIDMLIKNGPNNPLGYVLLGELQFNTGQFDEAEATFNRNPAINSPFAQPHFFLGNLALRKGQADQAIDHYQKALGVNGSYVPARIALAE